MKAIILAAGYATRLYPLTENQPKPLLAVGEKPIIEHILDKVNNVKEIDQIFIVTNNKFTPHFDKWLQAYKQNKPIKIINDGTTSNEDRLGAVGDVNFVLEKENIQDEVMVIAGDNLFEFELTNLMNYFNQKNTSVVALYDLKDKNKVAKKLGIAITDPNSKIIEFEEKPENPKTTLASTGCYIFKKQDAQHLSSYVKNSERWDNPGDFLKWLMDKSPIHGFTFTERWFDIGSFEALEEAYNIYGKG